MARESALGAGYEQGYETSLCLSLRCGICQVSGPERIHASRVLSAGELAIRLDRECRPAIFGKVLVTLLSSRYLGATQPPGFVGTHHATVPGLFTKTNIAHEHRITFGSGQSVV